MHDLPVRPGMSLDEAHAALAGAGIAWEHVYVWLRFTIADLTYDALVIDGAVRSISSQREVSSFDEVRALLREQIARSGPPLAMGHHASTQDGTEGQEWMWNGIWASVHRSRDDRWTIMFTQTTQPPYTPGKTAKSTDELRALARDARPRIAAARPGEGARAAAVAAWREIFEHRIRSLEAIADVVESIAPATPIVSDPARDLAEHADWLARHDELFDHPDDHRGAIVIAHYQLLSPPTSFGWLVDMALRKPEKQPVLLADGPFAYGVYRRMAIADELYPDPGGPEGDARPSIEEELAAFRAAVDAGKPHSTARRDRVLERLARARATASAPTPRP